MTALEAGVTRTGQTYRVQRQRGTEVIRASFPGADIANAYSLAVSAAWARNVMPPPADGFANTFADPRPGPLAPSVPTRLDDLVEAAIVTHQTNKQLSPDGVPTKMRSQWRKYGSFFDNPDVRTLTRSEVHAFARHLYEQRLARRSANEHLRLVRMACDEAIELDVIRANIAKGVVGLHQDNPRRPFPINQPRPLSPAEVKALAAQFDPWLRISVFLMYVGCLRLSEAFGIEIRDWDPVALTLKVRRQGGRATNEDKRDPYQPNEADGRLKTKSSRRTIPLPPALADAIDEHIATHHGMRPEDPVREAVWLKTRLISTPQVPKPNNSAIAYRWDVALRAVGLDFETIGYTVNRHFLRKSGSTVIGIGNIRGKLWSAYLGHDTPAEFGASLTTVRHYFDLPEEELIVVAERWEDVITSTVGDLTIAEEWWASPHVTISEAALMLGVHKTHVGWLVRRGDLLRAPDKEVRDWRHKAGLYRCPDRIMVSGPSLHAEVDRRRRLASTLTETNAADELGVSVHYLKALRARGLIDAGQRSGGDAWRYDRADVAELASRLGDERAQTDLYMSLADAASAAGLAQHEFVRVHGSQMRSRVLLVTERREYLREDVANITQPRVRPSRY